MNEETTNPVAKTTDTRPTETIEDKAAPVVDTPVTAPDTTPQDDPATPVKPEQPKKLADVVPTTLVWISGMIGGRQIDCAGPIELPFALTKPEWPYTTIAPNSNYANQVFDYDSSTWVATDAKSQGQQISDLAQKVQDLQKDSENHDKSADRAEKMGVQTTRILTSLMQQISTISQKLDTVLNTKEEGNK